jgi:hypothetical protein
MFFIDWGHSTPSFLKVWGYPYLYFNKFSFSIGKYWGTLLSFDYGEALYSQVEMFVCNFICQHSKRLSPQKPSHIYPAAISTQGFSFGLKYFIPSQLVLINTHMYSLRWQIYELINVI